MNIRDINGDDSFEKRNSRFTIHDYQQNAFASFTGDYEVGFGISESSPFIYVFRPFIDECTAIQLAVFGALFPSSLFAFFAVSF